jgi:hypothetical protein
MIVSSEDKVSSDKIPKNRAQNSTSEDKDDNDDILHTLEGQRLEPSGNNNAEESTMTVTTSCYLCYYCDYKAYNKECYETHVVLKHCHSPAYPNKAEIEKRGLKAQGKSWEV